MADTAANAGRPAAASPGRTTSPSIPVALNEASLDSPTFRCVVVHYADQIDALEKWLDGYVKSTAKVVHEFLSLEETINNLLSKTAPPPSVAEGIIDQDYTLLALKRVGDGQREWWNSVLGNMRKVEGISIEPIRTFLGGDVRTFKEARRTLDQAQKTFDTTLARYVAQSKTKEPSSIREDAFAVYETRKAYLKASMDFCQLASQLRYTLDKLLVRVSADLWREMKRSREASLSPSKWGEDMERIRGWAKEMESSEAVFKRELQVARREIGENTLATFKPSRELDDYSASTVPFLGTRGPMSMRLKDEGAVISEKQGWLFLRTISGKPARINWIRRWYYCRDGIFGWLVQGPQGVLQGDEIGVLLCSAKPAVQDERRFCFEIKTKSVTLLLQAETQTQLMEWLEVFEVAKKRAFDASMNRDNGALPGGLDPAFAITPPSIPEFSAKSLEGAAEEAGLDRAGTLPVPGSENNLASRASFDVAGTVPRRSITALGRDLGRELAREEGESSRDHAARIMQKLDLHRKATFSSSADLSPIPPPQPSAGIASLISAGNAFLPAAYAGYTPSSPAGASPRVSPPTLPAPGDVNFGSLAPLTLARPPVATSLSRAAVYLTAERGITTETGRGVPTAVIANYWGSNPWSAMYSTRQEDTQFLRLDDDPLVKAPNTPAKSTGDDNKSPVSSHRKTLSDVVKMGEPRIQETPVGETFPPNYPPELKVQHPQFRLLFPNVPLEEKLVLIFNATWSSTAADGSSNTTLSGNGRIYVTPDNMYFYGHQMGMVVAYTLTLDIITEVTAAPGKDCDLIFLHLGQDMNDTGLSRIAIKTYLEDLPLLHARLNLLIDDLQSEEPMDVPEITSALANLENEEYDRKSPSVESWEEISSNTPIDDGTALGRPVARRVHGLFGKSRSARNLRKQNPKFQLPTRPVVYEPDDMQKKVEDRHFEISAKACFHVLFGDKSFIFPKLYFERRAKEIAQGPWELADHGKMKRQFKFKVDAVDILGRSKPTEITDYQTIDVFNDHMTYVVIHVKTAWHLPHSQGFKIVTKVVITHLAKSKCKMAIYTKVDWTKPPAFSKNIVQRQALDDAARDAEELADVATDQVRKLGPHSRTKRAIQVYGGIGQQTQVVIFTPGEAEAAKKAQIRPRTLTAMMFDTVRSFAESAATSLIMWAFAVVRKLFKVASAHRIILLLLGVSVLTNVIFTGRESLAWWTERRAAQFMDRIGVGPNIMMSKAIYLADLEEAAEGSGGVMLAPQSGSECYNAFQQILNATDIDSPYEDAGAVLSSATSKATARRLRRTRQRLGSYRHDLLVAMRVVNSIEREMVQSEWENWLADENVRCEEVALMLAERGGGGGGASSSPAAVPTHHGLQGLHQNVLRQVDEKTIEALRGWHREYCGSCRTDRARLVEERKSLGGVGS
ncbi:PH domain-containing protein [Pleurostoma richardsiae]|uniref:PH domain-containing protein n=1 Tax=Pleurostoma richardsiae TaxID=41990 RepID=A0AA38RMU5_9PEZI|nr:PH domain-containing protein [Pleurostoma richardsiae]